MALGQIVGLGLGALGAVTTASDIYSHSTRNNPTRTYRIGMRNVANQLQSLRRSENEANRLGFYANRAEEEVRVEDAISRAMMSAVPQAARQDEVDDIFSMLRETGPGIVEVGQRYVPRPEQLAAFAMGAGSQGAI